MTCVTSGASVPFSIRLIGLSHPRVGLPKWAKIPVTLVQVLSARRHLALGSLGGVDLILDSSRVGDVRDRRSLFLAICEELNSVWFLGLSSEIISECCRLAEIELRCAD